MQIAVLGAGVIGLTTASALVERGHRVTLVDRQPAAGLETSFGNGAQLSYAYVAPLASAALLAKLPGLLFDRNGPIRVRPSLDPAFIRWGLAFLAACNDRTARATTRAQLDLAAASRAELMRLKDTLDLEFGWGEPGKLVLFRHEKSMAAAARQADMFRDWGIEQEVASPKRCLELEPTLRVPAAAIEGGVFTPSDQVGDCAAFCTALADRLHRSGQVTWRLDTTIEAATVERGRLRAIRTDRGAVEADAFVLCLAQGSVHLARSAGFRLGLQPMKGYSLTVPTAADTPPLRRSVTDFDNKIVYAPLRQGNRTLVRVAGIADLVGGDVTLDRGRLDTVRHAADAFLALDRSGDDRPWTGFRPMTPDGRPIIGPAPVEGLFLNTGHGALGWTLACGSAQLSAELIDGAPTTVDPAPFAFDRPSWAAGSALNRTSRRRAVPA